MNEETCPQCLSSMTGYASRLVQDSCGHTKCRMCLLLDENGCRTCENFPQEHESVNCEDCDANKISDNLNDEMPVKSSNVELISGENHTEVYEGDPPSILETQLRKTNELQLKTTNVIKYHVNENTAYNHVSVLQPPATEILKCTNSFEVVPCPEEVEINSLNIPAHITPLNDTDSSFQCSLCTKILTSRLQANRHVRCLETHATSGAVKNLKCTECEQTFVRRSHLVWHIRRHTGDRPFVCDVCKKSFTQKGKLNRHVKLHTGETPFKCKSCSKQFRTKDALRVHFRTHSGEKPYVCQKCSAKFADMSNLKKHQTIHTNEKPFMCSDCGATFSLKWRLTVHQRVHSREKPHACSQCSRAFNNIKDLHRHEATHSSSKLFTCNKCNTFFQRKDNLQRHIKNTHPEIVDKSIGPVKTHNNSSQSCDLNSLHEIENPKTNKETINSSNGSRIDKMMLEKFAECETAQSTVITSGSHCISKTNSGSGVPVLPKTNAVSVINGPVKLAFKTNAFKNNYNIKRKEFDVDHNVDIYKRILSPMTSTQHKDTHSGPIQIPLTDADTIIRTLNSANDSNDIIKHKMVPISVPRSHYETSFENGKHAIIKNIKFKLPPDYRARLYKFNSLDAAPNKHSANEEETTRESSVEATAYSDVLPLQAVRGETCVNVENEDCRTYAPLLAVSHADPECNNTNVYDKQNCVRTITKTSSVSEVGDYPSSRLNDLHWRRRTSQILQPKLNGSLQ